MDNNWQQFLIAIAAIFVTAAVLGLVGLLLIHRSLRRLRVPPNADLPTTLRIVPLSLVVVLDLLDLGLDVFAAPIVWIVLSRYRLQALRNTAAVEALIPFTQAIPTLTIAWLGVRILNLGRLPEPDTVIDTEQQRPGHYVPRTGRR